MHKLNRRYLFFSVKDRNLFHRVDTIGNIFTSGAATSENITDGVHEMKKISIFNGTEKKNQIFCLFHAFNTFWEKLYQNPVQFFSVIPRGVPLPHSNVLQYHVKREKFKVNDVIFSSGCEARAINLGNKHENRCFHWCYHCKIEKYFYRYFSISYRKA